MISNFRKVLVILVTVFLVNISCSSDDGGDGNSSSSCSTTITDQTAQGNFRGISFTSPGGSYREQNFDGEISYFCRIYVEDSLDVNDCVFPDFEGTQDTILFGLSSLEAQNISLSDDLSQGVDNITLNFNRIDDTGTESELACGTLVIDGLNAVSQLTGSIVATGVNGSTINGNFVLDFCETGF